MKDKKSKSNSKDETTSGLSSELNHALLTIDQFLADFPAILNALDSGEYVNTNNITNETFRNSLNRIMTLIPTVDIHPQLGWYKKERSLSVSGSILKTLLDDKTIKQPTSIDGSERIASQQAPSLVLKLISEFPDLKNDFPSLLLSILDGNAVQLDDIENEDVRFGLEKLFLCLELTSTRDGFALPEGKKQAVVMASLKHILRSFDKSDARARQLKSSSRTGEGGKKSRKESKSSSRKDAKRKKYSSSSSSSSDGSSSDSSSGDEFSDKNELAKRPHKASGHDDLVDSKLAAAASSSSSSVPRVGPTMPSAYELTQAQLANQRYTQKEEDDDEDDFGPQMFDPAAATFSRPLGSVEAARLARIQQQPLGFIEQAVQEADQPVNKYQERYGEYVERDEEAAALAANSATEREEWILDPGQNKLIGGEQ